MIDGRTNGGVSVFGSNRRDVLIRARIQANARTEERAEEVAGEIRIRTDGGRIPRRRAGNVEAGVLVRQLRSGSAVALRPRASRDEWRHLGRGCERRAALETLNGGIHLEAVAGDVVAETTNGGMNVLLDGDRWQGKGLDAVTTNGGVTVRIPDGYSAHAETGTVNGGINIDFPVTVGQDRPPNHDRPRPRRGDDSRDHDEWRRCSTQLVALTAIERSAARWRTCRPSRLRSRARA